MELMETTQAIFSHSLRENPVGEARKDALGLDFRRLSVFESLSGERIGHFGDTTP